MHDVTGITCRCSFNVHPWKACDFVSASDVNDPKSRLESVRSPVSRAMSVDLQTIAMVKADVSDYNAEVLNKIVTLHNSTVDQVNRKIDQYMPQVRKYDHM